MSEWRKVHESSPPTDLDGLELGLASESTSGESHENDLEGDASGGQNNIAELGVKSDDSHRVSIHRWLEVVLLLLLLVESSVLILATFQLPTEILRGEIQDSPREHVIRWNYSSYLKQ